MDLGGKAMLSKTSRLANESGLLILLFLFFGFLSGGKKSQADSPQEENKVKVFVSIAPQAFFLERVGGSHVEVGILVSPGQSPHTYEPSPREASALARATVFFTIGMPFEKMLIEKISSAFRGLEVVDSRQGIVLLPIEGVENKTKHGEEEMDPHFWLDPKRAVIMAGNMAGTLSRIDPAHSSDYQASLKELEADLADLDTRLEKLLAPFRGRAIYVYHPAFGYFTESYGLRQVAVEKEGKELRARDLAELAQRIKADSVKVVFAQPQVAGTILRSLESAMSVRVVMIDPLSRDYIRNLELIGKQVARSFENRKTMAAP